MSVSISPRGPASALLPAAALEGRQPHPTQRSRLRHQARQRLVGDLRGGLIAGLLTVVSTISYASVAGAPLGPGLTAAAVLAGLVAAALGGPVATWLGSLPTQVFAPRASVAVVIATAATTFAAEQGASADAPARTLAMLALCLLLSALLQVGLGVLRLGGLIRLIPHPVTAGLTIAIALKLGASQWPQWLGAAGAGAGDAAWLAPFLTGGATLAAIGWAQWRGYCAQAMLIGLGAGLAVGAWAGLQPHLAPVQWTEGPLLLPALLRVAEWAPRWTELASSSLLAFAFVIALVNSMETLTSTLTLEEVVAQRFDPNRALMAGAVGSLIAVCMGGLPVAGGAATSVANVRAGGSTRLSALLAALIVVAMAAGGGAWVAQIPLATVAAIMSMVALGLATTPLVELAQQWRRRHDDPQRVCGDLAVAALVGVLMLSAGMLVALTVGVLLATWLALVHMRAGLVRQRYDANDSELPARLRTRIGAALGRTIHIIEIGQPLFFATVETVLRVIEAPAGAVRFVVVDLRRVGGPDATAARSLSRCAAALQAAGRHLVVVRPAQAASIDHALRGCAVFDDLDAALEHCVQEAARGAPHLPRPGGPPAGAAAALPQQAEVEGELGWFVGPIAPVHVRRAASRSRNVRDMLRHLAVDLHGPDQPDSLQFRLEHLGASGMAQGEAMARVRGGLAPPVRHEALDRVGRELASDLAAISGVLARRVPVAADVPHPPASDAAPGAARVLHTLAQVASPR